METKTLRKFDLVTSVILIIGSILHIIASIKLFRNPYNMDPSALTPEKIQGYMDKWFQSPALLPLLVGSLLLLSSIILFCIAWKSGARFDFFKKENFVALKSNKELRVFCQVMGMLAIYIFVLIPVCRNYLDFFGKFQGFPFLIATFVYMLSMMVVFETDKKNHKKILLALVVAAVAATLVVVAFSIFAKIPMP